MQLRLFTFLTAVILFAGSMIPVRLAAQDANSDIVTFEAAGAGTTSNFGTFPGSINSSGAITGRYIDANRVNHGFLRTPRGDIVMFDAPGAGTDAGLDFGTFPESINDAGAITGYVSRSPVSHGFIRTPGGDFTAFDAPGVSSAPGDGTFPRAMNRTGAIVGNYSDANKEVNRGFLRSPRGAFTTFQAPGADTTQGSGNGTFPGGINDAGAITGRYVGRLVDGNVVYHGFVRSPRGEFTTFDAPESSSTLDEGTFPRSINDKGEIIGNYSVADKEMNRGFLRE